MIKTLLITIACLLKCFITYDVNSYVPGYDINIQGIIDQTSNTYIDAETGEIQQCPEFCVGCINSSVCLSCKYGYFLFNQPFNGQTTCIKCPLFDITQIDKSIDCADCIMSPLTWNQSKKCSFKYERIQKITNNSIIRYKKVENEKTQVLFEIYQVDEQSLEIQMEEFIGGDKWCGGSDQYASDCKIRYPQYLVDIQQQAVQCRKGFSYDTYHNECFKCPVNCESCASETSCKICRPGYALGFQFKCYECSTLIPNCIDCYYASEKISIEKTINQLLKFNSIQDMKNQGFFPRCRQCSQKIAYNIPSRDLKNCEDCSTLTNCLACRYAKVQSNIVIDHTNNPIIISSNEIDNYSKYCISCTDPYFVQYNGECEECDYKDCELCYGQLKESDFYSTLQQNFIYQNDKNKLKKKCFACNYYPNRMATMFDGSCENIPSLETKDVNCSKWRQLDKTLKNPENFECIECKLGYGFNASLLPKDRICDLPPDKVNILKCESYYYTKINGIPNSITCIRCQKGYTPSPSLGCIKCSTGQQADQNIDGSNNCLGCSILSPSGFNFTHYLLQGVIALSKGIISLSNYEILNIFQKEKAIGIEKSYKLNYKPFCNYCQKEKVQNRCINECFNDCLNIIEDDYKGCNTIDNIYQPYKKCETCGQTTNKIGGKWKLNQIVSNDEQKCLECPRYCQLCEQRSEQEIKAINPYFEPYNDNFLKYTNQCIVCRSINEICDDYKDSKTNLSGYKLSCSQDEIDKQGIFYDQTIKQCTPCSQNNQYCNRTLKIQQIIECRPVEQQDIQKGIDQNQYYQQQFKVNDEISHIFQTSVIFIDSWNKLQPLEINFKEFEDINYKNETFYYILNDENISVIEFEILLIPEIKNYTTSNGFKKTLTNVCQFLNDVNFSSKIARNIANIEKLSFTFKTINPKTGQIGQEEIDLFATSFNFQGWNEYTFKKINFLPAYSIIPTLNIQLINFKFSENLFVSKLYFSDINFICGIDTIETNILSSNFGPSIDVSNINFIKIQNVNINGFSYIYQQSLFQFVLNKTNPIKALTLELSNLIFNKTYFQDVDFIVINYDNFNLKMNQITFNKCSFQNSNLIKQESGYLETNHHHSVDMINVTFNTCSMDIMSIVIAYNLQRLYIKTFSLTINDHVYHLGGDSSLFTSNILDADDILFSNAINEELTFKYIRIFQLSSEKIYTRGNFTINKLQIYNIEFQYSDGFVIKMSNNQIDPFYFYGNPILQLTDLDVYNVLALNMPFYFLSLSHLESVYLSDVKLVDYKGGNFMFIDTVEFVTVERGISQREKIPDEWINDSYMDYNSRNPWSQNGNMFFINNLKFRFFLKDFSFKNLYLIDKVRFLIRFVNKKYSSIFFEQKILFYLNYISNLFLFNSKNIMSLFHQFYINYSIYVIYFIKKSLIKIYHEVRSEEDQYLPEIKDEVAQTYIFQPSNIDQYGLGTTTVLIVDCNFENINTYVLNSQLMSSIFLFQSLIKYRFILFNINATNIKGYSEKIMLMKDSSSFLIQDSYDSSLFFYQVTIKSIQSTKMQNGCYIRAALFFSIDSHFEEGNSKIFKQPFSFKGGFFNVISQQVLMNNNTFNNSVSEQGGAIYIKGMNNLKVYMTACIFENLRTNFYQLGYGIGGALSIDSSSSDLDLQIYECVFNKTIAGYKGGFLDLTCSSIYCQIKIYDNIFINNFSSTGSLFNIMLMNIDQSIDFNGNKISSNLTVDYILQYFDYYGAIQDNPKLAQYMIAIEGGTLYLQNNIFDSLDLLQGLLYFFNVNITDKNNTFSNSTFRFTPVIYYQQARQIKIEDLKITSITECQNCNLKYLTNITQFNQFFMIESPESATTVNKTRIDSVICQKCIFGILGIVNSVNNVTLQQLTMKKCFSNQGSLYIQGVDSNVSKRNLQESSQVIINNSEFIGNKAQNGGAIYVSFNSILINSTNITLNQAINQGGGIYFISEEVKNNLIILYNSTLTKNSAKKGGGIKLIGSYIKSQKKCEISNNYASDQGADITSYPISLKVFYQNQDQKVNTETQSVHFQNWVSSSSTNQELIFYLVGIDDKIQVLDSSQAATLTVDFNYDTSTQIPSTAKIKGAKTINYDRQIQGFNLSSIVFSQNPEEQLKIKATSSIIKTPKYDLNSEFVSFNLDYKLPIILTMRKCVVGEAFIESTGSYSLIENATQCLDCPSFGIQSCPGGDQLKLQSGYWRPYPQSDNIEFCTNMPENCNGGLETGDQLCQEGHVGALCEVCDISARFWDESYANASQFTCGKCSEIKYNILKLILFSIYTVAAIFFSVNSTKAHLDSHIIKYYFQLVGFMIKQSSQNKETVGIVLKLFTTYVQLIFVITTFNLKLPPGINDITVNVGDSVQQINYSMDCSIYSMSGDIPMTYFRLLWSQFIPIFYVSFYLIFHYSYNKIKNIKHQKSIVWIAIIYIYISMQPSIVKTNIQTISCREISGVQYIKANVSEICNTSQHVKWSLLLILPILSIWILIIPSKFIWETYSNRFKISKIPSDRTNILWNILRKHVSQNFKKKQEIESIEMKTEEDKIIIFSQSSQSQQAFRSNTFQIHQNIKTYNNQLFELTKKQPHSNKDSLNNLNNGDNKSLKLSTEEEIQYSRGFTLQRIEMQHLNRSLSKYLNQQIYSKYIFKDHIIDSQVQTQVNTIPNIRIDNFLVEDKRVKDTPLLQPLEYQNIQQNQENLNFKEFQLENIQNEEENNTKREYMSQNGEEQNFEDVKVEDL